MACVARSRTCHTGFCSSSSAVKRRDRIATFSSGAIALSKLMVKTVPWGLTTFPILSPCRSVSPRSWLTYVERILPSCVSSPVLVDPILQVNNSLPADVGVQGFIVKNILEVDVLGVVCKLHCPWLRFAFFVFAIWHTQMFQPGEWH